MITASYLQLHFSCYFSIRMSMHGYGMFLFWGSRLLILEFHLSWTFFERRSCLQYGIKGFCFLAIFECHFVNVYSYQDLHPAAWQSFRDLFAYVLLRLGENLSYFDQDEIHSEKSSGTLSVSHIWWMIWGINGLFSLVKFVVKLIFVDFISGTITID